jgi:hypothetical protein
MELLCSASLGGALTYVSFKVTKSDIDNLHNGNTRNHHGAGSIGCGGDDGQRHETHLQKVSCTSVSKPSLKVKIYLTRGGFFSCIEMI